MSVAGCSSGASKLTPPAPTASNATGRAAFSIAWPARTDTRLIPDATNSVRIEIRQSGTADPVSTTVIKRPVGADKVTTEAPIGPLPLGDLQVLVTAHPTDDGTGVFQAAGETTVTIKADQTTPFRMTLATTIASIKLESDPVSLALPIAPDKTITYKATAYDASGSVVVTAPSQFGWSVAGLSPTSGKPVASLSPSGTGNTRVLTTDSPGTATLTVKAHESSAAAASVQSTVKVSLLAGLPGRVAFQVEYPFDKKLPGGSQPGHINAYLMEATLENGQIAATRILVPQDALPYSTLNPNYSPDGRWIVFAAITPENPNARNTDVDDFNIYLIDTRSPGTPPRNLTAGMFPQDRCQDPDFSPDGTKLIFQTNRGRDASQTAQVRVYEFDTATGVISNPTSPAALPPGLDPLIMPDGTIVYIDLSRFPLRIPRKALGTQFTDLPLPSGYFSSYYVNFWKGSTILYTVNVANGQPDFLATYDFATDTTSRLGSVINQGSDKGGNNNEPCRVTDDLILFSRNTLDGERLFVGQPAPDRAEQLTIPNILPGEKLRGVAFTNK